MEKQKNTKNICFPIKNIQEMIQTEYIRKIIHALSHNNLTSASGRGLFLYKHSICLSRLEISCMLIFSVIFFFKILKFNFYSNEDSIKFVVYLVTNSKKKGCIFKKLLQRIIIFKFGCKNGKLSTSLQASIPFPLFEYRKHPDHLS